MRLSRDEVLHIASLCRIGVTDDDVARFQDQLSNILDQFEVLTHLDTAEVPPTSHPVELHSVFKSDSARDSLPKDEVLRNAPRQEADHLRIKAVLED
ncbi:MAG: Asp-tRNA(Asn)/Glu-tRNA(Gln) amidotransferase subunit GatC [Dehalococcoidia bacterium]